MFHVYWYGFMDQEYELEELEKNPNYYIQGMLGLLFDGWIFWKRILIAFVHAYLIYIFSFYSNSGVNLSGMNQDLWAFGSICNTSVILISNLFIFFSTHSHTIQSVGLILFGIFSYFIVFAIMSQFVFFFNFSNISMNFGCFTFYFSVICVVWLCVLTDYAIKKLPILFGLQLDPERLTSHHIMLESNEAKQIIMNNNNGYLGEAFSQENRNIIKLEKRVSIRRNSTINKRISLK